MQYFVKYWLMCMLLIAGSTLQAQWRDTVLVEKDKLTQLIFTQFFASGQPETIEYHTRSTAIRWMTKAELSRRAWEINGDSLPTYRTDSIFQYHADGRLAYKYSATINSAHSSGHFWYIYHPNGNLHYVKNEDVKGKITYSYWNETLALPNRVFSLSARINRVKSLALPLENVSNVPLEITISSKSLSGTLLPITIAPTSIDTVRLPCVIPPQDTIIQILVSNTKGDTISLPIEISGYDLKTEDFTKQKQRNHFLYKNRKTIYLKVDGTHRLLKVYRKKRLLYTLPTSLRKQPLAIADWKKGKYRLEWIDVGNGEKIEAYIRVAGKRN